MFSLNLNNSFNKLYVCVKWTLIWPHHLMPEFKKFYIINSCEISLNLAVLNEYKWLLTDSALVIIFYNTCSLNCHLRDHNFA